MAFTLKETMDIVKSADNLKRIDEDFVRYKMYNGQVRDVIKAAIRKEFERVETINELEKRIIPINLMQKIINKLAAVYQQPATRKSKDKNVSDDELIVLYEESFRINQKMKFANRNFKNFKHTVLEPFLDRDGIPRIRSLPSHTYTPMSDDPVQPERLTQLVKHVRVNRTDPKRSRFQVWTDEEFFIVNGEGTVVADEMAALNNLEGVNPFGVIPFTYIAENDDGNLIPISDDDLVSMAVAIPLLLSDLSFASKYQLWSILALIGVDDQKITFNPSSVINLPPGADVKVIKPEVDVEKALAMVEQLVGMLLTTKNLSVGDVTGNLSTSRIQSGIASLLDKAETTEDRKDQEEFFRDGEKEFWGKFAHKVLPVWVTQKKIAPEFVGSFTKEFELSIRFADPKPFVGDKDRVELEDMKIQSGFTTHEMALQTVHPDKDGDQIKALQEEIEKEKKQRVEEAQRAMQDAAEPDPEDEEE
jgi:hypothetical protein